ncbi:methyltransferase domain-containing protein [Chloroflexota bacterium]
MSRGTSARLEGLQEAVMGLKWQVRLAPTLYERVISGESVPWAQFSSFLNKYVFAAHFTKGKTVVEIGCSFGYGSSYLMSRGARQVIGTDIEKEAIEYATDHYQKDGLHFLRLDATQLPFTDSSCDTVILFDIIEHLEEYEGFLRECKRVMKEGGILVCSTPNKEVASFRFGKPLNPYHIKEFYIGELRHLLDDYFKKVIIYGDGSPQGKRGRMIHKLANLLQFRLFPFMVTKMVIFRIGAFIYHRPMRLVRMEEIEADFDRISDESTKPYLLQDDTLQPGGLIAVAEK